MAQAGAGRNAGEGGARIEAEVWARAALHQKHIPAPLHLSAFGHSFSGSVPVVMKPHVPFEPPVNAPRHDLHVPRQSLVQHTPFAQNPLAHSLFIPGVEHACPRAFCAAQLPLLQ
jgi:hypothetical protein